MQDIGRRATLAAGLALPFLGRVARAQDNWPNRTIRFIVAFAAGGAADTAARAIGAKVQEILGQSVVVENRTGGNAIIAANALPQAPADGYSFLVDAANQITNPILMRDVGFDYLNAFIPITRLAMFPQVVAVKHDFPARTIAEFIALARARPGTISCGTPPAAGMAHLALAQFQMLAGIELVHAPYRGGADAARDITAGSVDSVIITTSSIRPPVQAGRARVLAVTSRERVGAMADVPTLNESGFSGFDMNDWNGLFAAAGTPPIVLQRLQQAVAQAVRDPVTRSRMDPLGALLMGEPSAEFAAWLTAERAVLRRVIEGARITIG